MLLLSRAVKHWNKDHKGMVESPITEDGRNSIGQTSEQSA